MACLHVDDYLDEASTSALVEELRHRKLRPDQRALLAGAALDPNQIHGGHAFRAKLEAAWMLRDERAFYDALDELDELDHPQLVAHRRQRQYQLYQEAMRQRANA